MLSASINETQFRFTSALTRKKTSAYIIQTLLLSVCITFENFPNPLSVKMRLCKPGKKCPIAFIK